MHRDLKPSNILVDANGGRHVTDFGLAKRISDSNRSITETGQILGTPKYMSPEQAAGRKDLTVATDVYSLGVLLYERLTGQTPFTGENLLTVLRQARETEPPRPSSIRAGLDRDLETVVLKCLEKEPSRRYPSAGAITDDLANWLARRPITARPVGQAERFWHWCRRNPAVTALTATVALALVLAAVVSLLYAFQQNRHSNEQLEATQKIKSLASDLANESQSLRTSLTESNRRLAMLDFEQGRAACEQGQIALVCTGSSRVYRLRAMQATLIGRNWHWRTCPHGSDITQVSEAYLVTLAMWQRLHGAPTGEPSSPEAQTRRQGSGTPPRGDL